MKKANQGMIFDIFNYCLLIMLAFLFAYPFIYVMSASISSPDDIYKGLVVLWPKHINFTAYAKMIGDPDIWTSYGNSIFYTVVGTALSVFLTVCGAYPISKKRLFGGTLITFIFIFTMWFNAGIIPYYLNILDLNLDNTRTAIIFTGACSAFNIILVRTYFQSISDTMEEAAKIDGANDLYILWKIYLPLSRPVLATVSLFYAVGRWNSYFWPMIILKDMDKIPLQVLLKRLILEVDYGTQYANVIDYSAQMSKETMIYATIVIATIPMIIIYPFIQRYFEKGIMIGAVKG